MSTTLCISHVKDIDGLSAAALAKAATGCDFRLSDYDQLFDELDKVSEEVKELIVCDMGTDATKFQGFSERLSALSRRMRVTYIDHHYLTPEQEAGLRSLGIELVHDSSECAGMLTYLTFRDRLPEDAKLVALYAAVTDYMDDSTNAKRMMERFDRHFVLLESSLLSYALARKGKDPRYARTLVERLSEMRTPHLIRGLAAAALEQANVVLRLAVGVRKNGKKLSKLAYIRTTETSTGNVAKLLLGTFDVTVGLAYRVKGKNVEVSLRSTSESGVHLGKLIGPIALKYGGSGGGHNKAAGCTLPVDRVDDLIRDVDGALG